MILQALCGYYRRAKNDPMQQIVEPGYAVLGVSAELVIDAEGNLVAVNPLTEQSGKKLVPKQMVVPLPPKRSGQKPEAAFLYENAAFVFGIYEKPDGAAYRFAASADKHRVVLDSCQDAGAAALLAFFDKRTPGNTEYPEVDTTLLGDSRTMLVFRLQGDTVFLHQRPAIMDAWAQYNDHNAQQQQRIQCLITGEDAPLAVLHGNVGGFGGDKPTLVGFNQDSFCSFGKTGKQGANAPVGERAAFEYVTALNMLCRDRRHYFNLAGDKVVFWAEREAHNEESTFAALMGAFQEDIDSTEEATEKAADVVDHTQTERIQSVIASTIKGGASGDIALDRNVRFYILGLCANKTRLVIRFFYESAFGELLDNLMQHYHDLAVVDMRYPYPSPYHILLETAVQHKRENIAPVMEAGLMRSILDGSPYPQPLFQGILRRVRAEKTVSALRAGIIKAVINRQANKEVLKMSLDKSETDISYLLGRLFALCERTQYLALGEVNATVSDKYLNSALATPQMVFPTLMTLNQKHLSKLAGDRGGAAHNLRLEISSVFEKLNLTDGSAEKYAFPPSMDANGQGKFLVGYYHQTQSFYTKKDAAAIAE